MYDLTVDNGRKLHRVHIKDIKPVPAPILLVTDATKNRRPQQDDLQTGATKETPTSIGCRGLETFGRPEEERETGNSKGSDTSFQGSRTSHPYGEPAAQNQWLGKPRRPVRLLPDFVLSSPTRRQIRGRTLKRHYVTHPKTRRK